MPIDLCSSLKKTSQWAFGSPLLNNILGSSIFVAVVIALLMVLLIMCIYPAKSGTPFSVIIKLFIYMLFGSLLVIFLHDGVIKYMFDEEHEQQIADGFMRNVNFDGRSSDPVYGSSYVSINPSAPMTQTLPTSQNPSDTIVTGSHEPQHNDLQHNDLQHNDLQHVDSPRGNKDLRNTSGGSVAIVSIAEGGAVTGGRIIKAPRPRPYAKNPYL